MTVLYVILLFRELLHRDIIPRQTVTIQSFACEQAVAGWGISVFFLPVKMLTIVNKRFEKNGRLV